MPPNVRFPFNVRTEDTRQICVCVCVSDKNVFRWAECSLAVLFYSTCHKKCSPKFCKNKSRTQQCGVKTKICRNSVYFQNIRSVFDKKYECLFLRHFRLSLRRKWDLRSFGTGWSLKKRPTGRSETSVRNCHSTLRKIP